MHGVSKSQLSEEQADAKRSERQKKLERFLKARDAILKKIAGGQFDDDGLKITGAVLAANPDLYIFWNYRKRALLSLMQTINANSESITTTNNSANESRTAEPPPQQQQQPIPPDFERYYQNELQLTEECLRNNPKSYGAWFHRQWVLRNYYRQSSAKRAAEILKSELLHCSDGLKYDERNFHCWDHRRFICQLASVPEMDELQFSKEKVDENFSNYSAWHYRSALLPLLYPSTAKDSVLRLEENKLNEELTYVQNAFFTDPEDQSAWFYHWWLFRPAETRVDDNRRGRSLLTSLSFTPNEPAFIALAFSRPLKVTSSNLHLSLDDGTPVLQSGWSSPDGSSSCHVWINYTNIPEEVRKLILKSGATIVAEFEGAAIGTCKITRNNDGDDRTIVGECSSKPGRLLSDHLQPKLSPSFHEALEKSMQSCLELKAVEPSSNKWPSLTVVLAMRWLDLLRYRSEIFSGLDELMRTDARKQNYYDDLKSRYSVECKLLETSGGPRFRQLDLCGLGLTTLTPLNTLSFLTNLRELQLDNNRLRSSLPLGFLVNLVRLSADGNLFTNTKGLGNLLHLEYLSLASNRLGPTCADALGPLKKCTNLRQLIISENLFNETDVNAESVLAFFGKARDAFSVSI